MIQKQLDKRKWLHFIIVFCGLAAIVIIAGFISYQKTTPIHEAAIKPGVKEATISFTGVRHAAYEKGIKQWFLNADKVDFINEEGEAVFNQLSVLFYRSKGETISITAQKGIWKTNSNDLEVLGNVVIKNKEYELLTEKMRYDHGARKFETKTPVKIHGNSVNLSAKRMIYNLTTNRIQLFEQVEGTIGKNTDL